jgi:diguanylate cyclase (GGDEF)-like protein
MIRPGLTFKLSALLACIGILASGLTGYYAYHANRTMLVEQAEQNLLTSTQVLSQRLSSSMADTAADVLVLAGLPSSADVARNDDGTGDNPGRERVAHTFARFMKYHPEYLQIRLIARGHYGLELVRYDRDGSAAVRVQGDALQEKGVFPYVFETLALAPGHIYVSPITVNHEHGAHSAEGKPTLRIATPIVEPDGSVVGVLVIDVDLASLLKSLQVDIPGDYQVYLANEWGDFLIHPDPSQTFGFDKGRRILMQDSFGATRPLFDKGAPSVALNGFDHPKQAAGHVYAFIRRPFGVSEGNRFVVLGLSEPLHDVLLGANRLGGSIVRMVLIFSVLAIVLAIAFARALTQPLQVLALAATHFFSDKAPTRLPLSRTDEIGILARCFERMRGEIKTQMASLYHKQDELEHLASHDPLTGLPNRKRFMERLDASIREAAESGAQLAVLFVDLDRFKQINDQFGHAIGDAVLVAVSRRLQHVLRSGDVVARLGGDEFIVLVKGLQASDAVLTIAAKIKRALDEALVIHEQAMVIGASIGISQYPQDGLDAEALLSSADAAMYAAKSDSHATYLRYQDMLESQRLRSMLSRVSELERGKDGGDYPAGEIAGEGAAEA